MNGLIGRVEVGSATDHFVPKNISRSITLAAATLWKDVSQTLYVVIYCLNWPFGIHCEGQLTAHIDLVSFITCRNRDVFHHCRV